MTVRNLIVAPLALAVLVGTVGYLGWPGGAEMAPSAVARLPDEAPAQGQAQPAGAPAQATGALRRSVATVPDNAAQRAAWRRDAAAIQRDLIAAVLSGDSQRIAAAEARARRLAAAQSGR